MIELKVHNLDTLDLGLIWVKRSERSEVSSYSSKVYEPHSTLLLMLFTRGPDHNAADLGAFGAIYTYLQNRAKDGSAYCDLGL